MNDMTSAAPHARPNEALPWPQYPPALAQWIRWTETYPFLAFLSDRNGNEGPPPAPMTRDELARLVGSLRDEHHREVLKLLLLDLLFPSIKKMLDKGMEGKEL